MKQKKYFFMISKNIYNATKKRIFFWLVSGYSHGHSLLSKIKIEKLFGELQQLVNYWRQFGCPCRSLYISFFSSKYSLLILAAFKPNWIEIGIVCKSSKSI